MDEPFPPPPRLWQPDRDTLQLQVDRQQQQQQELQHTSAHPQPRRGHAAVLDDDDDDDDADEFGFMSLVPKTRGKLTTMPTGTPLDRSRPHVALTFDSLLFPLHDDAAKSGTRRHVGNASAGYNPTAIAGDGGDDGVMDDEFMRGVRPTRLLPATSVSGSGGGVGAGVAPQTIHSGALPAAASTRAVGSGGRNDDPSARTPSSLVPAQLVLDGQQLPSASRRSGTRVANNRTSRPRGGRKSARAILYDSDVDWLEV